jgi:hypothetical protein
MAVHRRLPTGAEKSGVLGDHGGLGAGGERRRAESGGKQSKDFPDANGRNRARIRTIVYFTIDARGTGTADGRHIGSPICAPNQRPTPTRRQGGLQSGQNGGRVGPSTRDFMQGVIIAPQPARQRVRSRPPVSVTLHLSRFRGSIGRRRRPSLVGESLSPRPVRFAEAPPPQPSPASGRGSALHRRSNST